MVRAVSNGCLLVVLLMSWARPAAAADPENGARLAERWCSACHLVAPNRQQVAGEATPFRDVARRPGFDAPRLAFFLLNPHPVMPDMSLTRGEAEDLAAYISTLR